MSFPLQEGIFVYSHQSIKSYMIIDVLFLLLQVDMPVFFYIDPEIDEDIYVEDLDTLILSYTFFEAKEGMTLPMPGFS